MINKLLFKLTAGMPCLLINTKHSRYLERYYVGKLLGVTFYLHRFVSGDAEDHIHNHPWKWGRSVILTGDYVEQIATDLYPDDRSCSGCLVEYKKRRWYNRVDHNTFHRISDAAPKTWTLFFHGARLNKGWGFIERAEIEIEHGYKGWTTIFIPVPSAASDWHETKPLGRDSGRLELDHG